MATPTYDAKTSLTQQPSESGRRLDQWLSADSRPGGGSTQHTESGNLTEPGAQVAQAALTIVGGLEQAVVMIARDGTVWFQNEAARRFLSSQPDIRIRDGVLACPAETDQHSLENLIAKLPWTVDSDASVNRVLRLGTGANALILVARAVAPAADSGRRLGLIVLHRVEEPEMRHTTALLREAFSLTRAEAAVAAMIAGGNTPAEIASHRNVSVETIRAQLRVLYSKTRTNRQAELVRLVNRLTALS
ncbi:MAG: helix-turn-helix transcriptional regulator [Burkholderiaceae bacterium]